jgi:carboxyl-terminal processing protease
MKRTAGIIFRTLLLILVGVTIGMLISDSNIGGHRLGLNFAGPDKISRVLDLVSTKYVDSVNTDSVAGVTVNDMLQSLDPHSVYLPAQQARSINERLEGGFNGIGLEYQLLRDTLVITQVNADGPAAKAGVVVGDRVINVDGKAFSGTKLTIGRISKTFRGEKDTHIALGIQREQSKTIKDFDIKRMAGAT